jgi:hypothetical protein
LSEKPEYEWEAVECDTCGTNDYFVQMCKHPISQIAVIKLTCKCCDKMEVHYLG